MAWSIDYADGAANRYRLRGDDAGASFEYDPVTPAQSSTGHYAGGPPRAGVLSEDAVAAIREHVDALAAARTLHLPDRVKGSGAFTVTDESGTRSFLVTRSEALAAWDTLLGALR